MDEKDEWVSIHVFLRIVYVIRITVDINFDRTIKKLIQYTDG